MRLIDADALLSERMRSMFYHLPNGDTAVPVIDIEHAPTVGGWISTKDRTPEQAGCYLAYRPFYWACGRGQITICYWDGKTWFDHYIAEEDFELWGDSVSYWMPLPKPPEEVTQDG